MYRVITNGVWMATGFKSLDSAKSYAKALNKPVTIIKATMDDGFNYHTEVVFTNEIH